MKFKKGLCSISFRSISPEKILAYMKKAGLLVIEWGSDVHAPKDDIERLKYITKLQKEYQIKCSSYGTYFRLGVTPIYELDGYIKAAKILGTDILRLWCGNKNSEEYTPAERTVLFKECRAAANIAEQNGVTLCMECHGNTYTNTKESAYELMQEVNSESFRMYWQPNQNKTLAENLEYAKLLSMYTVNIHIFNWKGREKYPLKKAVDIWKQYLACFDKDKTLLLEFMPDGNIESLEKEAQSLEEITE